jgi:PKD repeat protein
MRIRLLGLVLAALALGLFAFAGAVLSAASIPNAGSPLGAAAPVVSLQPAAIDNSDAPGIAAQSPQLEARTYPGWVQVATAPITGSLRSLSVFGDKLFAAGGTDQGAVVWVSPDGNTWSQASPAWGAQHIDTVLDAQPFGGSLYVGRGNGEMWRTDGVAWTQVVSGGFGDWNNIMINALAVFSGSLYAATSNTATGIEIWRSATGEPGAWEQVNSDGFGEALLGYDVVMGTFAGHIYAGFAQSTSSGAPLRAELWRSNDGVNWTRAFTNALGNPHNSAVTAMEELNGQLYIGLRNLASEGGTGGEVWRSSDGLAWTPVFTGGLGDVYNGRPYGLISYDGRLYLNFGNRQTGAEVWRTSDGTGWERIVSGGWGDSGIGYSDYLDKGAVVFHNRLYIATLDKSEIWRKTVTAGFTAAPGVGGNPLAVEFSNSSAGDYTSLAWDFGDGVTGTVASVTHVYSAAGFYTATLTVSDGVDVSSQTRVLDLHLPYRVRLPIIFKSTGACLPTYFDDFSNPNSGWPQSDNTDARLGYLNGEYQILQKNGWGKWVSPGVAMTDGVIVADMRFANAGVHEGWVSNAGIMVGGDPSNIWLHYVPVLCRTGRVVFNLHNTNGSTTWLGSTYASSAVDYPATNRLKVVRDGSEIRAYVNGEWTMTVNDSTFPGSRWFGVSAGPGEQGSDIRFDNYAVYPLYCAGLVE